jgi:SnoaL-like domain
MVHPDFVYENDPAGPLGAAFRGRAEVKRFWEDWFGTWKDFAMEPYEIREAPGGKFVVRAQLVAYLEGTAEPLRMDFTHLWTFGTVCPNAFGSTSIMRRPLTPPR